VAVTAAGSGGGDGGGPDVAAVRGRLQGLDRRYRYSAALTHATGLPPWDDEVLRIGDLARALEERPEDAISAAIQQAEANPEWAASRAGRVEAITVVLAGVAHDAPPRRMDALGEYARQLRAALTAPQQGTSGQAAAIAADARQVAERLPAGPIRDDLGKAADALGAGNCSGAWRHLDMARRAAAGEFNDGRLVAALDDGTAAHEAIGGLMQQLAPAPPTAGGSFADRLHAADIDESARRVDTRDLHGGPEDPLAAAVAGQLRAAAQCLRGGHRDTAQTMLTGAALAAWQARIRMHGAPAAPLIARHAARLEARLSGRPEAVGSLAEQGTAYARRMRQEDPAGPPPLVVITRHSATTVTAVDDMGREFDVTWGGGAGNEAGTEVTVGYDGRSLTAPAGHDGPTRTARELAGRLAAEQQPDRKRAPRRAPAKQAPGNTAGRAHRGHADPGRQELADPGPTAGQ
jgi:hypothetical protein